jgi:hypothetical protein
MQHAELPQTAMRHADTARIGHYPHGTRQSAGYQHITYCRAKGRLLAYKRRPFSARLMAFWKPKDGILKCNGNSSEWRYVIKACFTYSPTTCELSPETLKAPGGCVSAGELKKYRTLVTVTGDGHGRGRNLIYLFN